MFIARDDNAQAQRLGTELCKKVKIFYEHPEMGRPLELDLPPGVRVLVLDENYLAYYRTIQADGESVVQITRIKHAAQSRP